MDPLKAVSLAKSDLNLSISKENPLIKIRRSLKEVRSTFRESGLKGVVRRYGWKIFAAFFVYYLVRDLTLYIVIPWVIARHFTS